MGLSVHALIELGPARCSWTSPMRPMGLGRNKNGPGPDGLGPMGANRSGPHPKPTPLCLPLLPSKEHRLPGMISKSVFLVTVRTSNALHD